MSKTAIAEQSWTRLRSSLGRKNKPSWPEPELSIGMWYRKMGISDCWEAIGPARDQYGPLSEEIKSILDERIEHLNKGEPVSKTVTFSPYMTGWKRTNAKPTIIFCCERPLPRRRAKNLIKSSGILNKYPGWILGDSSFPPEFDKPLTQLAFEDHETQVSTLRSAVMPCTALYRPSKRAYGIEIFIQGYGNPGGTRRATVGGIIRSQGKYYGLTVAHAFSGAEPSPELVPKIEFEFELDSSYEEEWSNDEMLADETSRGSQSPASRSPRIASSIISRHSEVDLTEISYEELSTPSIPVPLPTQADDASIIIESIAEPQQTVDGSLVVFGDLSMSAEKSGLASLDWALILIRETEIQSFKDLDMHGPGPCFLRPDRAVEPYPRKTAVIAITASGDMLHGSLSGTPSYIHVPQTKNFQEVWTVNLEGKLKNGDCGTWVMDERAGMICGHIISGTIGSGATYIIPAFHVFNDIGTHLLDLEIYVGGYLTVLSKSRLDSNFISAELIKENQNEAAKLTQELSDHDRELNKEIEALHGLSDRHEKSKNEPKQDMPKPHNQVFETTLMRQTIEIAQTRIESFEGLFIGPKVPPSRHPAFQNNSAINKATASSELLTSQNRSSKVGERHSTEPSKPIKRDGLSRADEETTIDDNTTGLPKLAPLQHFGTFAMENELIIFKYKPDGRNIENGRELIFTDSEGRELIHRIIFSNGRKRCYSYTPASGTEYGMVTFQETPSDKHEIIYEGKLVDRQRPVYRFVEPSDRKLFQEVVRDQELVEEFVCDVIDSQDAPQAREEVLQVWRSKLDTSIYISYYTSLLPPKITMELPITVFENWRRISRFTVCLSITYIPSDTGFSRLRSVQYGSARHLYGSSMSPYSPSINRSGQTGNLPDNIALLEQMTDLMITFSSTADAERFISLWRSLKNKIARLIPEETAPASEQDRSYSQLSPGLSAMYQRFPPATPNYTSMMQRPTTGLPSFPLT